MSPGLLNEWRNEWRLRRGTAAYVESLLKDPEPDDLTWLSSLATSGDDDRARWELRYARRALGVLVAQRDSMDDRTGAEVAHALSGEMHRDRHVATDMINVAERQFNERLTVYRDVLTTRRPDEGTGTRLGRALLRLSGSPGDPGTESAQRAGEILVRYLGEANDALRKAFGTVSLPDDLPPSAVRPGRH
ncbi:MAG: hypothetical protein MNPFHGCM_03135 [Gemmatimonadaceae bacterium]|nr:hypothetical protein [Gemmatimonadaceae bacterium]